MPLITSHIAKSILKEILKFKGSKDFKNFYLQSKNLTGAGKTTILNKIKSFCILHKIPYIYIKNLCSIKNGLKVKNTSEENFNLVSSKITDKNTVFLCDEVKDPRIYEKFKETNIFVYTGYDMKTDIGEQTNFYLLNLDNQFQKEDISLALKTKYPNKVNLIEKILEVAPNFGQAEICLKEVSEGRLAVENLPKFCKSLMEESFWERKNIEHFLFLEKSDNEKIRLKL
jgi:hypothetical protein